MPTWEEILAQLESGTNPNTTVMQKVPLTKRPPAPIDFPAYVPTPPEPEKVGALRSIAGNVVSGALQGTVGTAGRLIEGGLRHGLGATDLAETYRQGNEGFEEWVHDTFTKDNLQTKDINGVGSALRYIGENVGNFAGQMLPSIFLMGGVGGIASRAALKSAIAGGMEKEAAIAYAQKMGERAVIGAATVSEGAQEGGIIYGMQGKNIEEGKQEDYNHLQGIAGTSAAAALGAGSTIYNMGRLGLTKALGASGVKEGVEELGKKISAKTLLTQPFVGALSEGVQESAQTLAENYGATNKVLADGETLTPYNALRTGTAALTGGMLGGDVLQPTLRNEMFESGAAGAAGGFGLGAIGAAGKGTIQALATPPKVISTDATSIGDNKTGTTIVEETKAGLGSNQEVQGILGLPTEGGLVGGLLGSEENILNPELIKQGNPTSAVAKAAKFKSILETQLKNIPADADFQKNFDKILNNAITTANPATLQQAYTTGQDTTPIEYAYFVKDALANNPVYANAYNNNSKIQGEKRKQEALQKKVAKEAPQTRSNASEGIQTSLPIDNYINSTDGHVSAYNDDIALKREQAQQEEIANMSSGSQIGMFGDHTDNTETKESNIDFPTRDAAKEAITSTITNLKSLVSKRKGITAEEKVVARQQIKDLTNKIAKQYTSWTQPELNFNPVEELKIVQEHKETVQGLHDLVTNDVITPDEATLLQHTLTDQAVEHPIVPPKGKLEKKPPTVKVKQKRDIIKKVEPVIAPEVKVESKVTPTAITPKKESKLDKAARERKEAKEAEAVVVEEAPKKSKTKVTEKGQESTHPDFTEDEAQALVKTLLGNKAELEIVDADYIIATDPNGNIVRISAQAIGKFIQVASGSATLYENVRHEAIHVARTLGIINDKEWKVLQLKANKWIKDFGIEDRYKGFTKEELQEEAIARAFEINPKDNTIFGKLKNFFEKIVNTLKGLGFNSSKSVFSKFESGAYASRSVNKTLDLGRIMASLKKDSTSEEIKAAFEEKGMIPPAILESKKEREDAVKMFNRLKEKPLARIFKRVIQVAEAVNSAGVIRGTHYNIPINNLYLTDHSSLSFADIVYAEDTEGLLESILDDAEDDLTSSIIYKRYKSFKKKEGLEREKLTDAEWRNRVDWNLIKKAIEEDDYISFHSDLSRMHNATEGGDWDLDCSIFSFYHTGYTDPLYVPELFLPPAGKDKDLTDEYIDNAERIIKTGYRARLGLDADHEGLLNTPLKNLIKDSNLIKEIINISKPENVGTIIQLKDFKSPTDRNIASMTMLNWLEKIGPITILDIAATTTDKVDKVSGEIRQRIESFAKDSTNIAQFMFDRGSHFEQGTGTEDEEGNVLSHTSDLTQDFFFRDITTDITNGDTYIKFNPEFKNYFITLAEMDKGSDLFIDEIIGGKRYKIVTPLGQELTDIIDTRTKNDIVRALQKSGATLDNIVDIGIKNVEREYQLDASQPLDKSLMDIIDSSKVRLSELRSGAKKKLYKALGKSRKDIKAFLKNDIEAVRNINGYEMPIKYSVALYLAAKGNIEDYNKSRSTTILNASGAKEFTELGRRLLFKALGNVLLHQKYFDVPMPGNYEALLNKSMRYFDHNGTVVSKVTRANLFSTPSTTELDNIRWETFTPAITQNILMALNVIDEFGIPIADQENQIKALEDPIRTDLVSTYGSVQSILDALQEDNNSPEESAKIMRAYSAMIKRLKASNVIAKAGVTEAQSPIRQLVSHDPELIKEYKKLKDGTTEAKFFSDKAAELVNKYSVELFKLLEAPIEDAKEAEVSVIDKKTKETNIIKTIKLSEESEARIRELVELLDLTYESKNVSEERNIQISVGSIFDAWSKNFSTPQRDAIVPHIKDLIATVVLENSTLKGITNIVVSERRVKRVSKDSKESETLYFDLKAADDVKNISVEEYTKEQKPIVYTRKRELSGPAAEGDYGVNIFEHIPTEEEKIAARKIALEKHSVSTTRVVAKPVPKSSPHDGRIVRPSENDKRVSPLGGFLNLRDRFESKESKSVVKLANEMGLDTNIIEEIKRSDDKATKQNLNDIFNNSPFGLFYNAIISAKEQIPTGQFNIGLVYSRGEYNQWIKFFNALEKKATSIIEDRLISSNSAISVDKLNVLKADLEWKIKRYFAKFTWDIEQKERTPIKITQDTSKVELSADQVYKSKGTENERVRIVPATSEKPIKGFVRLEVLDYNNKVVNKRTVSESKFERDYEIDTENTIKDFKKVAFDAKTNREIISLFNNYGEEMRENLVKPLLTFLKNNDATFYTPKQLTKFILAGNVLSRSLLEDSGLVYTSETEADFKLDATITRILSNLVDLGLAIQGVPNKGEGIYGRKSIKISERLVNFLNNNKLGSTTKASIISEQVRTQNAVLSKFDQASIMKGLKQTFQGVSEIKLFKFIKDAFITPWYDSEKHPVLRKFMFTAAERGDKRATYLSEFTEPLEDVVADLKTYGEEHPDQQEAINKLVIKGDIENQEYTTLKEAQAVVPNITQTSLDKYIALRKALTGFSDTIFKTGARVYMVWANMRYGEHGSIKFSEKLHELVGTRDIKEPAEIDIIVSKLLEMIPVEKRAEEQTEMRKSVRAYIDWLDKKRTLIHKVKGWMPRVRFVKDYVGSVRDTSKKNNPLVAFKYFKTLREAQEYIKGFDGVGYDKNAVATEVEMKNLFTSMDQIKGFENLEHFLKNGMSEDWDNPQFGVSTLTEGHSGGQHLIRRKDHLVEGYETENYLQNYITAANRMANSFSQLEYGLAQRENLHQARLLEKTVPIVRDTLPKFVKHLKDDLSPATSFEGTATQVRNATVFYFMGFRMLPAIINTTQNFVIGVPNLAKELTSMNGKSYVKNLFLATKMMHSAMIDSVRDLITNVLHKDKSKMLGLILKALDKVAPEGKGRINIDSMSDVDNRAIEEFNKYNIATQNLSHTSSIMDSYKEGMAVARHGKAGEAVNAIMNEAMVYMRLTEQVNRTGAFLAAYRLFSKGENTFNHEAAEKAVEFVYNTNFMMNSFNMPLSIKKLGPAGRTIMTLSTYPIHYLNSVFRLLGGTENGGKTVLTMVGAAMMLGGVNAVPLKDFFSKIFSMVFKKDLNISIRESVKAMGGNEWLANTTMRGLPPTFGVDVANNISFNTPYIGGWLGDKNAMESATGAAGGMASRASNVVKYIGEGQYSKAIWENLMPEVVASRARVINQYNNGMKTSSGSKQMYKGQPLELSFGDALTTFITTAKSANMGTISEKRNSMRKLETQYKSIAANARRSYLEDNDPSKINKFNQLIIKNKLIGFIKPIGKVKQPKENSGRIAFENQLSN